MSPRVFTLQEVNELVPLLKSLVGKQLERRGEIESRLRELSQKIGAPPSDLVVGPDDPLEVRNMKQELALRVEEYQVGWRDIEDIGGVLKDPKSGVIDFYGRVDGKLVWLCWRFGDEEVRHYLPLDDAFANRKILRKSAKWRLIN